MDELEILHITKNLEKLIQLTSCNSVFLAILKQNFILDQEDIQKLKLVHLTEYEQARQLYSILEGRQNAYQILMLALKETKQSGAFVILEELFQLHPSEKTKMSKVHYSSYWTG
ncbi:unnamed protein product [Orchesella dallaii]|uniref:CARD domain-containing protein n=1 Tax=Orchesella dallaii TaxID=48710 RepID=A0ABP1PK20_9HEXA